MSRYSKKQNDCVKLLTAERENRLSKLRKHNKNVRANQSPEDKEKRLCKGQEYLTNVRANESPEVREKRLCKQREYETNIRANETPQAREKRLSAKRQLHKTKIDIQTIPELIDKFHNAISLCYHLIYARVGINYGINTVFLQLKEFHYNTQISSSTYNILLVLTNLNGFVELQI